MSDDLVVVGVVRKPFGVRGDAYVQPDADLDHEFPPGATYTTASGTRLTVAASRLHTGRRVVRFEGVADREAILALRGTQLLLPRSALSLADDAFWASDLLGREVRDEHGTLVGVVEGLRDGPAHDYLLLARTDGGEVLVPAVADLLEITPDAVVVRAIPGLLDPEPGAASVPGSADDATGPPGDDDGGPAGEGDGRDDGDS